MSLEATNIETDQSFGIKVSAFEGPLELLLHLIKEQKINIYDIIVM